MSDIYLYSRKDFIEALKNKGLPSSIPYLDSREADGTIKRPKLVYQIRGRFNKVSQWRFFTQKEIDINVQKIQDFEDNRNI